MIYGMTEIEAEIIGSATRGIATTGTVMRGSAMTENENGRGKRTGNERGSETEIGEMTTNLLTTGELIDCG